MSLARAANPKLAFPPCSRTFLTFQAHNLSTPSSFCRLEYRKLFVPAPCSRRTISLGSIFSSKPEGTPTPHTVALITRLEAEANVHPHDLSKQLALYEALLDTKMESSYELVINRWEKMCEFVSKMSNSKFLPVHSIVFMFRTPLHHY
jgi:ATP-dependent metalloprotease